VQLLDSDAYYPMCRGGNSAPREIKPEASGRRLIPYNLMVMLDIVKGE
jgi:hypothetical protein